MLRNLPFWSADLCTSAREQGYIVNLPSTPKMRKLSFQNFLTCHFLCNKISLQFSLNDVSSSIVITFLLDSILRLKEEFSH